MTLSTNLCKKNALIVCTFYIYEDLKFMLFRVLKMKNKVLYPQPKVTSHMSMKFVPVINFRMPTIITITNGIVYSSEQK